MGVIDPAVDDRDPNAASGEAVFPEFVGPVQAGSQGQPVGVSRVETGEAASVVSVLAAVGRKASPNDPRPLHVVFLRGGVLVEAQVGVRVLVLGSAVATAAAKAETNRECQGPQGNDRRRHAEYLVGRPFPWVFRGEIGGSVFDLVGVVSGRGHKISAVRGGIGIAIRMCIVAIGCIVAVAVAVAVVVGCSVLQVVSSAERSGFCRNRW
mmetsp:Transcript_107054/g.218386  ORF Transcript_107054/g.218386 Transcript_107054/m.218386 type:complete len:209 (-) Transcript_107054:81-707(-)